MIYLLILYIGNANLLVYDVTARNNNQNSQLGLIKILSKYVKSNLQFAQQSKYTRHANMYSYKYI